MVAHPPSSVLLQAVRGAFVQQGTSLAKWCLENSVTRQYASAVLTGGRNGPSAQKLRLKIIRAAFAKQRAAA